MVPTITSCLVYVFFILVLLVDHNIGQRINIRYEAQVKILSETERASLGTAKALRTQIRKNRRRAKFGGELDFTTEYFLRANGNITGGCRKQRVSRFIGNKDRNCTSAKPVRYSRCGGFCLPKFRLTQLLFGRDYNRVLQKAKHRWRCVADSYRYKKVRVICPDDGSVVRYKVKIINSCVCKEFKKQHNEGKTPDETMEYTKRLQQQNG
eukprot:gene13902-4851_t